MNLDSILNKAIRVSHTIVVSLIILVLFWLSALSMHSTSFVLGDLDRYNVADTSLKHVVLFFIIVCLSVCFAYFRQKKSALIGRSSFMLFRIVPIAFFAVLLWYLISTQPIPIEDQRMVCDAAVEIREQNFRLFAHNQYMDLYGCHQAGMILFLEGLFVLFGDSNYLAFQIINALAMTASVYYGVKIFYRGKEASDQDRTVGKTLTMLSLSLFLPWLLFASYVYGTPIGFFFVLKAIDSFDVFLTDSKVSHLILMGVFAGIAAVLKRNFLIYLIALSLYLILYLIKRKNARLLIGLVSIWVCFWGIQSISESVIEYQIGKPLSKSIPQIAFFAMAFTETEDGMPVGFNGYTEELYRQCNGDRAEMEQQAAADLQRRLQEFRDEPRKLASFLAKKIAIQWNEPTFESIHVNTRRIEHKTAMPQFFQTLFRPFQHDWYSAYANLIHCSILLGTLAWFVVHGYQSEWHDLFFAICMLGCFILHLVTESGSRYSVTFFYGLIPYAVEAYLEMGEKLCAIALDQNGFGDRIKQIKRQWLKMPYVTFAVLLSVAVITGSFSTLVSISDETFLYNEKLAENKVMRDRQLPIVENGRYYICPASNANVHIQALNERDAVRPILQSGEVDRNSMVTVFHDYEYDLLRLGDEQLLLSLDDEEGSGAALSTDGDLFLWKIEPAGDNLYRIKMDDYYLSAVGTDLRLEPASFGNDQLWRLEKQ